MRTDGNSTGSLDELLYTTPVAPVETISIINNTVNFRFFNQTSLSEVCSEPFGQKFDIQARHRGIGCSQAHREGAKGTLGPPPGSDYMGLSKRRKKETKEKLIVFDSGSCIIL